MTTMGELQPLPILEAWWDTVSVDFIAELSEVHGFIMVMNVVDSVSKRTHFIPTMTTLTAPRAARLYLANVWKLHRLPSRYVRLQTSVCCGIHMGALSTLGHRASNNHSLPSSVGWANGEG